MPENSKSHKFHNSSFTVYTCLWCHHALPLADWFIKPIQFKSTRSYHFKVLRSQTKRKSDEMEPDV